MTEQNQLRAIGNDIIFQFEQSDRNVSSGKQKSQAFEEKTDWGFEFHNFDETAKAPRWAYIVATGPMATSELQVGMRVLIESLMWTNHVMVNGEKYWKTNDNHILAFDADSME